MINPMLKAGIKIIGSRLFKSPKIINVCYFVTYKCNANCLFCNIGNKSIEQPELDSQQAKNLIDQLSEIGVHWISLVGGEPLLRKDLPQLIDYINQKGMQASIVTNGLIVKPTVLDSKPKEINVSLDFLGNLHDTHRNVPMAFKKALEAIAFYSKNKSRYRFTLGINIVLMPMNIEHIEPLLTFLAQFPIDKINIQPLLLPQVRDQQRITGFSHIEIRKVDNLLKRIHNQFGHLLGTSSLFLKAIPEYLKGKHQHNLHCFSGSTFLNITPDGEILPCLFMGSAGNIKHTSLKKIIKSNTYHRLHKRALLRNCCDCLCPDFFEPNLLFYPNKWNNLLKKIVNKR